ncbi:hypothetical protein, partial [Microcoleus sp.]|uniref:hypothetical protein n=1 Tax=Microcoleus sp. TaxID=44472 RepID=UPI00403E5796
MLASGGVASAIFSGIGVFDNSYTMGERGAACLLCPNLSVTAVGLVRHIQTAHVTDTVDDINKAFRGVKTFRQCPYCPER